MKQFKYANLQEEYTIQDIDNEIDRLQKLANDYRGLEQGTKVFLNSIYGGCASPFFLWYNPNMAEAITLQGQDLIKYSGNLINRYFNEFWHKDQALHKNIETKYNIKLNVKQILNEPWVYSDTDSCFFTFNNIIEQCDGDFKSHEIILDIDNLRLTPYLNKGFDSYAAKHNTKNYQVFELETIAEAQLLIAKKKYALDVKWASPSHVYESHTKIKAKGIEIVQSSTPPFSRKYLNDILKMIFVKKKSLDIRELVGILKKYKEEFYVSNIDEIALQMGIGDYEKAIVNDKETFEVNKGCPAHVRGAGHYNYLINNSPKYKRKYSLLKSGDKVKFYYTTEKDEILNIFAYLPGQFPVEIAPSIDYAAQFQRVFLDTVNRLTGPLKMQQLNSSLIISKNLF